MPFLQPSYRANYSSYYKTIVSDIDVSQAAPFTVLSDLSQNLLANAVYNFEVNLLYIASALTSLSVALNFDTAPRYRAMEFGTPRTVNGSTAFQFKTSSNLDPIIHTSPSIPLLDAYFVSYIKGVIVCDTIDINMSIECATTVALNSIIIKQGSLCKLDLIGTFQ